MVNKIREHVDALFETAPKTKKVFELKEELLSNLTDKYNDLIARGYDEEQAYNTVISGIGDVDELIRGMVEPSPLDWQAAQEAKKKTALVVSSSVGLYIFSVVQLIALAILFPSRGGEVGVIFMFMIIAAATCLLIYHFMSRPAYHKQDETMVEEFKEWKQNNTREKRILSSISSILWTSIVAIYLVISFWFGIWHISWIIFIIGAVINNIIKLVFDLRK